MNQASASRFERRAWLVFVVTFSILLVAGFAWSLLLQGPLDRPPEHWNIDGVFYDNIALNLSEGKGFVVDFQNEKWRNKYQQAFDDSGPAKLYEWVLLFQGSGPTAMRSPGFPYALSLLYRFCDWRFDLARCLGLVCASLGLAVLVTWSFCRWGWLVSILATLTIIIDYSVMQSAGQIASESLAILALALSFVALAKLIDRPTTLRAIISGATFAMLFLTRGNWNLGLLLVIAGTVLLLIPIVRSNLQPIAPRHVAVALITAIVLAAPWWIRNCIVTKHVQPFGTAGSSGLVAAYCNESLADYGNWKAVVFHRNQREVFKDIDLNQMPLAEREYLVGQSSQSKAFAWAGENWFRLPQLAVYRYLSHWGLFNRSVPFLLQLFNIVWLVFGLIGCLFLSAEQRKVFTVVLVLDALIVMLTWAHLGRYGIPVRPLLHIGCAILIFRFWRYVLLERGA